jgi:hypothetical protein
MSISHIAGIDTSGLSHIAGMPISGLSHKAGQEIQAALTCQLLTSNASYTSAWSIHRYNTQEYPGFIFDDGSAGSICNVKWSLGGVEGDTSGLDYYCEVWLLDGSNNLTGASPVGRSDKVDGTTGWTYALVEFPFTTSAPYDCTGANKYGILLKAIADGAAADAAGTYSGTNYPKLRFNNGTNSLTHNDALATWTAATKALQSSDASDAPVVEVHTLQ